MDRIIELKWNCNSCGSKGILGRHKVCPECASPREEGEMQMDGLDNDQDGDGFNDAETVQDEELKSIANAGYDWFCTHCSSGNRGDGTVCLNCGASRYPLPRLEREPEAKKEAPAAPPRMDFHWPPFAALGGVLTMLGMVFLATRTHVVEGAVESMTWEREVHVQAWTPFTEREWEHRANEVVEVKPINGKGARAGYTLIPNSCTNEFFKDEEYQCGTQEQSYDCSTYHTEVENYVGTCSKSETYTCGETCRNQGNGFAKCSPKKCTRTKSYSCPKSRSFRVQDPKTCYRTVPKYCTRPIYKDKCTYTSQTWSAVRTLKASGTGKDLRWPEASLMPLEKTTTDGVYTVVWRYQDDGESESFTRNLSEGEYLQWDPGQRVYIKLNFGGGVSKYSATPFQ